MDNDYDSFSLDGIFLLLSVSDLVMDLERAVYLGKSSFLIGEIWLDRQDNIFVRGYFIFCIGETRSDLHDMDLPIFLRSAFGPSGQGLRLGWYRGAWVLHWAHHSFGLGEWDGEPVFLTPSALNLNFMVVLSYES